MADNTPLKDGAITLRDFRVDSINLIGANGIGVDIRLLVVELIIRQDLFTNYMHGEAVIVDGVDTFTVQGLHGSEYLYINLFEPGTNYRIRKAFRIFKVTDRTTTGAQLQRYKIHFVSDEMMISNIKRISRSYKGRTISDVASDILTNYLMVDKYIVESTDSAMDLIIPNLKPTEALNWLAARATNGEKNTYLFYENLDGMNFRSLHTIYEEKPCNSTPIRFEAKAAEPELERNKYNIDSFRVIRDFDTLTLSANGGTGMRLLGIDPFYRTMSINDYHLNEIHKMHDVPAVSNINDQDGRPLFEHYEAHLVTYLQTEDTSTEKRNNSEKWISRQMALANIKNSLMDIVVPGNMVLQVGKLVNIKIPNMIPATKQNMENELRSGNYLIVSCAHKFNLTNFTFDTIATLSRDSVPVAFTSADAQLVEKVNRINE